MSSKSPTLIVGGQARLPKDLSTGEPLQVVVELDSNTNKILDVSFGPCQPVLQNFLVGVLKGTDIEADTESVLDTITKRVRHRSQKAILAAIRDLAREYNEFKYGVPKGPQENHLTAY